MTSLSSRCCCSVSFFLALFVLTISSTHGQEKDGEFKHELPEGVELVDPKSLGLTDVDLSKFLGNVKVLGGGQVGDTKTQILTVGFDGDENINFNDFHIPGLTDGNNTKLPEKEKEIAMSAFQKFKEFFEDPRKANQFEEGGKHGGSANPQKHEHVKHGLSQQKHPHQQNFPHQFPIPMIHKPYTTPNSPLSILQVTTHHPLQRYVTPPPPPPPPPSPPSHPPRQPHFPPIQTPPPQQQLFNAQIKSQPPPVLEFGARIPPVTLSPHVRPPPQPISQPVPQPSFHNPQQINHIHIQQPQQHQQPVQRAPEAPPRQHFVHLQPPHIQQQTPPPPQVHFIQHPIVNHHNNPHQQQNQQRILQPTHQPPPTSRFPPRTPPPSPRVPIQTFNFPPQQAPTPQNIQQSPAPPSQGRIVRNQLLHFDSTNNQNNHHANSNLFQTLPAPSASNQISIQHSTKPQLQPPYSPATATSHVYINRGPKAAGSIQHTSIQFHPSFQPPTRMSKDFTPLPFVVTTTSKPTSFDVTPSMKLIPLSTNENAITDPGRMLQLRLYQKQRQQQKQQQKVQASSNTEQIILPQATKQSTTTAASTVPPSTTTPISITTSYPEIESNQQQQHDFGSSFNYQSLEYNNQANNNEQTFSLHGQQQQHQLHTLQQQQHHHQQQQPKAQQQQILQNGPAHQNKYPQLIEAYHPQTQSQQQQQPQTVFYTQEHRRPPRHGHGHNPHNRPRFQFHMSHEMGQPLRIQMNPDPKTLLNTIRRKRGYRRLSNLFNRMFRWDSRN